MRLGDMFERVSDSWWPIPTVGAVSAVVLAMVTIGLDKALDPPPSIAFNGTAVEALQLLSTTTSAMLSFIALVFSVSIVVFTLVSGQYSPRVLRTFLRDRWSQITLAVFVGTFLLTLIALWAVRSTAVGGDRFVPRLTVTLVFALLATCVGLFVHFVHHITQEIRAVTIIGRIHTETVAALDRRYPDADDAGNPVTWQPSGEPVHTWYADTTGVIANVRAGPLVELAREHDVVLELVPRVGDFVIEDQPVVRQYGDADIDGGPIRDALAFDPERSYRNDVPFGIRKLVDVAERALSPGINDPTTAIQCLDRIHAILFRLAGRELDVGAHGDDGAVRFVEPVPTWSDYVRLSCDELRHWGADSIRVHERLRDMLNQLLTVTESHRHPPLRRQLEALAARADTDLPEAEQASVGAADAPSRADDARW
ncbi:DUF2254 domain-containing protein [soil metagenome]